MKLGVCFLSTVAQPSVDDADLLLTTLRTTQTYTTQVDVREDRQTTRRYTYFALA